MANVIILFLLTFSSLFIGYFHFTNQKLKRKYSNEFQRVNNEIMNHQEQMNIRKRNLDKYDFLKYNLSESLYVQKAIVL